MHNNNLSGKSKICKYAGEFDRAEENLAGQQII